MSCKKSGFVSSRHNDLRDLTARIVSEFCKDTEIKPKLLHLYGEELHRRTKNQSNETRLDIRAQGIWNRGQQAFFKLRVFDPNACIYLNKSLQQWHAMNGHEKNRSTTERCYKSTTERSHLWYFQFTVAWEENAKCFIHGCLS